MSEKTEGQKVLIVGAGPVGALAALYAAGRGDNVEIYELRSDLRDPSTTPLNFTKSINLALSERGINSMRHAQCEGLIDAVLGETIPMHGRMIHGRKQTGELYEESQQYDVHGRSIRAVDRAGLNKRLLDHLGKMPNVTFHFNHKLTGADFNENLAWFEQRSSVARTDHAQNPTQTTSGKEHQDRAAEISVPFDVLIGTDGAHSATRYHMMKYARVNYQQEYIDTLWCEFIIPPDATKGSFAISANHLHIWPGKSFMFIAIPSLDQSFTCTLFAPSAHFADLTASPDSLLPFFQQYFPGVCPELISPDDLNRQFRENPHLPLISIKCTPYHYRSSVVILGDAAHAMVPFYGQGMNAGLEDARVLFDMLDKHGVYDLSMRNGKTRNEARANALLAYTTQRTPDASAINDLALRNYEEMRSSVVSPFYRLRKWVEERVNKYIPSLGWSTQYSRVSFENERYSEVEKAAQRQGRILMGVLGVGLVGLGSLGGLWWWRWNHTTRPRPQAAQWFTWAAKRSSEIGRNTKPPQF
ncbi:MAG: kynurenine 3-monooxygenase [Lasallia pustulata]|uniref:Kynurenine 3-monooxygenase n=1 Tax=Lasallia pustulata TaxID=136370 RepID=A0A5M8PP83_9LECA|nr:MAG: kynurenine 3-monooxygenase [Lasallia pustulata]